jgi:hypothetical protein
MCYDKKMKNKVTVEIEQLVEYMIIRMRDVFATKEELDERLGHLPTKDEFYQENDKLMKELKDLRDEVSTSTYRTSDNTDRIEKLEEKVLQA